MKRAEAIKQIAAILDKVEDSGQIILSLSIRQTKVTTGFISGRESFAKRVELVISQTIEGECAVVTESAR